MRWLQLVRCELIFVSNKWLETEDGQKDVGKSCQRMKETCNLSPVPIDDICMHVRQRCTFDKDKIIHEKLIGRPNIAASMTEPPSSCPFGLGVSSRMGPHPKTTEERLRGQASERRMTCLLAWCSAFGTCSFSTRSRTHFAGSRTARRAALSPSLRTLTDRRCADAKAGAILVGTANSASEVRPFAPSPPTA